jgi:predicted transcriptional regulator
MTAPDPAEMHNHGVHKNRGAGSKRVAIAIRRRQVAELYLQRTSEAEIAEQLGVNQATISRDIQALRAEWRTTYLSDTEALVLRDLADLDALERECMTQLRDSHDAIWALRVVQIKARRSALLGLDAPAKIDIAIYVRERAKEMGLNPDEAEQRVREHLRLVS